MTSEKFIHIFQTEYNDILLIILNVRIWSDTITMVFLIMKAINSQIIDFPKIQIILNQPHVRSGNKSEFPSLWFIFLFLHKKFSRIIC